MSEALAVGLAQVNPVVGDIDGNVERIRALRHAAGGEDLLVFGELALAGYPPEDLLLKRAFQDAIEQGVGALAADTADGGPALPGATVADSAAGGMHAAIAILAALVRSAATGEGEYLDVSVAAGVLWLMSLPIDQHLATGQGGPDRGVEDPHDAFVHAR